MPLETDVVNIKNQLIFFLWISTRKGEREKIKRIKNFYGNVLKIEEKKFIDFSNFFLLFSI
jgi:hypothetical protein